ncbi:MAG: HAD-IA family hydrolase [Clostridia bacterium]|nr:HAD-IA family hydrolase [Clostridia bacterium]
MEQKAVLFDMDGVLVNSEEWMMKSAVEALEEWGVHASKQDFRPFIGAGEARFVGGVAEKYGVPYVPEMKTRAYQVYGRNVAGQHIACPHVRETIQALRADGWRIAVCSSADVVKVRINVRQLGMTFDDFDLVLSGDSVERKKPFPDIFLRAAADLCVPPERCVVVEDAVNGILAARAAGMRSIGMTTSFTAEQFRQLAEPTYIVDDLAEIPPLLVSTR